MILVIDCILKFFFHFLLHPKTQINCGIYSIFVKKMKNIFIFLNTFQIRRVLPYDFRQFVSVLVCVSKAQEHRRDAVFLFGQIFRIHTGRFINIIAKNLY